METGRGASFEVSKIARRVLVAGRVQGVGFRFHASDRARTLAVDGWVRNLVDGRVEVFAEGDEANVAQLIEWLRRGPRGAKVERIELFEEELANSRTFEIRR